jgi:ClpA/ClpB-like protein
VSETDISTTKRSSNLDRTVRRALDFAGAWRHEYATLEHLLLALTDDEDATAALRLADVDFDKLRRDLFAHLNRELVGLVATSPREPVPTAAFDRVFVRAADNVRQAGRDELTGADVLAAMCAEHESHAVYLLQEQNPRLFGAAVVPPPRSSDAASTAISAAGSARGISSRLSRVLLFALSCALGIMMVLGAQRWLSSPDAKTQFIAEFNENIKRAPIEAAIIAADAEFRSRVLQATTDAYGRGGWPAANDVLDAMMREKQPQITWTLIHADDSLVVALWRRYGEVVKRLADKPAACRYYTSGSRGRGVTFASAQDETGAAKAAALAAYQSGAANLENNHAPEIPSEGVANLLFEKSTTIGTGYTEQEWAALSHGRSRSRNVSDETACSAYIRFYANLLTLSDAEAAQLIRYQWGGWIQARAAKKSAERR